MKKTFSLLFALIMVLCTLTAAQAETVNLNDYTLDEIIAKAQKAREDGCQILIARMNKNKKFQKEQLIAEGYEDFEEFYKNPLQH